MKKRQVNQILIAMNFMILMAALGSSDSMRGVFAPAFQSHFGLNVTNLSVIVMVSYIGNLVFLCLGGRIMDRCNRKKAAMAVIGIWVCALILYAATDSYPFLLAGMFLAMGASTLLNTTVNILSPCVFTTAPVMMVNIFFFVQGIGTSASQNLAGRVAGDYGMFKKVNLFLAVLGIISLALLWRAEIPEQENHHGGPDTPVPFREIVSRPGFALLIAIFGLYFVAEHGIMNWLVSYGTNALGMGASEAAFYLSIFYGGMTVGRLVFSPVVAKLGAFRSIRWFGGIGSGLFVLGILAGGKGMWMLSLSGLAVSILYPTMVYMIHYIYPSNTLGAALGAIISIATLFDIGFNAVFGKMADLLGYGISFMVIPFCMAGFYASYLFFAGRYQPAVPVTETIYQNDKEIAG